METPYSNMVIRAANGRASFIAYVRDAALATEPEAERVLAYYLRARILRMVPSIGSWTVKHGVFLEPETLKRCIEIEGAL